MAACDPAHAKLNDRFLRRQGKGAKRKEEGSLGRKKKKTNDRGDMDTKVIKTRVFLPLALTQLSFDAEGCL